jgi:cardiolipin synthase (CMP-forming)
MTIERGRGGRAPSGEGWRDRLGLPARLDSPADRLTAARLAMVPGLWMLAAWQQPVYLGLGVALAGSTDVLDGYLARRSGRTTPFGSRFDSVADHLLTISTGLWLLWLRPEFVREQRAALLLWASLALLVLVVGWLRFRRLGDLHLRSAKLAGTLGYLFAIWLLVSGSYSVQAFAVVIGVCYFAAVETLTAMLLRPRTS